MRRIDVLAGMAALFAVGVGVQQAGCVFSSVDNCDLYPAVGCPGVGKTGSSGTSGTGGTGGTGGSPVVCLGDPTPMVMDQGNIRDECAVFVQSGSTDPAPDGTMEHPYATLQEALEKPKGNRTKVFACAPVTPFNEAVTVSAGLEVYGGFDCSKMPWTWTDTGRTELDGPADKVALTVDKSAANALVSGWTIKAAKPSDPMGGGSSVAVAVDDVAVTIERSDISADDAANGTAGTTPTDPVGIGQDAPAANGAAMNACINPGSLMGGAPGVSMCGTTDTSGGLGGKGGITGTNSGDGQAGAPGANPAAPPPAGMNGAGGVAQAGASTMCLPGNPGAGGLNGNPANGGSAMDDVLTLSGVINSSKTDGIPGTPAQGGGGGGAAKSGVFCPGPTDGNGASGGGAGAGGCGGKGGGGGKAGGSSLAIISLGAKLTIVTNDTMDPKKNVTLKTGKGGVGGNGAIGQPGGSGGSGAKGGLGSGKGFSIDGCQGGDGGFGGAGGPGGGGRGGHSMGIAFAKAPAAKPIFMTPPTLGVGGPGGLPGAAGGTASAPGASGAVCDFSKPSNPCQ